MLWRLQGGFCRHARKNLGMSILGKISLETLDVRLYDREEPKSDDRGRLLMGAFGYRVGPLGVGRLRH